MIISIIPPEAVMNHMAKAKEYLSEVEYMLSPRGTVADLIADCITGTLLMWGVFDPERLEQDEEPLVAVLITRVSPFWRCNVLELIALAGEHGSMRTWIELMNNVTDAYAQSTGCLLRVIAAGRPQWERYLAKYGFKRTGLVTLECPVGREIRRE